MIIFYYDATTASSKVIVQRLYPSSTRIEKELIRDLQLDIATRVRKSCSRIAGSSRDMPLINRPQYDLND